MKSVKGQLPETAESRRLAAAGEAIRDAREAQGLAQGQLGTRLRQMSINLTPDELARIEYGRLALTPEQARAIEQILHLPPGRLDEIAGS